MGGGGALEAAKDRPSLRAAVPLTPWNLDKTWPEVRTPTMIIGAENDSIASVSSHAEPFYNSLSNAREKAYLELNGASHFTPNTTNATISRYAISWLKRSSTTTCATTSSCARRRPRPAPPSRSTGAPAPTPDAGRSG